MVALLAVINLALLTLALFFIQEGEAQRANPDLIFFVRFPTDLLPLAYLAGVLLIPNLAVLALTLIRRTSLRPWPWFTTFASLFLLAMITARVGFDGIERIINP